MKASDNEFPKVIITEGTAPSNASSGTQKIYIDSSDHHLKRKNSSGDITDIEAGSNPGSANTNVLSRDKNLSAGTFACAKMEWQSVAASATQTILNYTGGSPGLISRIFIAIEVGAADTAAIRESHLKIYYDGNGSADIDVPVNLFFGAEYIGDSIIPSFASEMIGANSDYAQTKVSYYCNIPIPFNTGIKVDFVNGSGARSVTLWAMIDYYTGVSNNWTQGNKLQCATGTLTNQAVNTVISLVDVSSINPGRLVGVYTSIDGGPNTANPRGAAVEGNFKIYRDGSGTALYESSGFEDYFGFGFAFQGGGAGTGVYAPSQAAGLSGFTFVNVAAGTFNAFRFHVTDPLYFTNALKVTWNCGNSSQNNFTGGERVAWCVWYYTSF